MNKSCCLGAIVLAACVAAPAGAQTQPPDISELSLQQLLEVEITSTASKFPQQVTHAPASITIVTADEIRRYAGCTSRTTAITATLACAASDGQATTTRACYC
jgi:outer membrane receptor for ferrienterochelin and colicin